jgi:hypothetical protein
MNGNLGGFENFNEINSNIVLLNKNKYLEPYFLNVLIKT